MKICILTPRFPFPENAGDVLRINNIARYLKEQGHNLILLSFVEDGRRLDDNAEKLYNAVYTVHRNKLLSTLFSFLYLIFRKPIQCGYYYSPFFYKKLQSVIKMEEPDLYLSHLLRMTPYLEKAGVENKSIVEMTDALSKTYSAAKGAKGGVVKKFVYKIERSLILKYESKVINSFPKVVLVSTADVEYLKNTTKSDANSLTVHPNGVDFMKRIPNTYDNRKICFVGNMRTLQNQDAVIHFVEDIFPLILKRVPDAMFYIIGAEPSAKIRALASENIIVTGFVNDINVAASDSCIAVAPVRVAAGIQNKVLVAMGCGVPVVLSSMISKAIPELQNAYNCFIQDDNEAFADVCIELLTNVELRARISKKEYETVREHYSWEKMLEGYLNPQKNISR